LRAMAERNITFRPRVPRHELRDLYRRARAFVYAAVEDFGITPVEAQACGCPVVAYNKGGLTETVIHGETGLFFPEQTSESLLEALCQFERRDFSGKRTRKNAERFSKEAFLKAFRRACPVGAPGESPKCQPTG
ncbi:glycosyltransferase, partial [bacterium]|nr:glycosyltransferase [bacterium]